MINIAEIENTIKTLEQSDTTFVNCQKLADLYIVKDYLTKSVNEDGNNLKTDVIKEYNDILPMYTKYIEVKRRYQLNELSRNAVIDSIKYVCKEIEEFLHTLYSSTDTPEERELLTEMMDNVNNWYKQIF